MYIAWVILTSSSRQLPVPPQFSVHDWFHSWSLFWAFYFGCFLQLRQLLPVAMQGFVVGSSSVKLNWNCKSISAVQNVQNRHRISVATSPDKIKVWGRGRESAHHIPGYLNCRPHEGDDTVTVLGQDKLVPESKKRKSICIVHLFVVAWRLL